MTADNNRKWAIPTDLTNAEERIFASQAKINYKTWLTDLAPLAEMDDELEQQRLFVDKMMDPYIMPALILIAAKRENPTISVKQVIEHLDAGEWELDFESLFDQAVEADVEVLTDDGGMVPAPLAPPAPPATLNVS